MLRQKHSGGSSTSRPFAKTALLPTLLKTFQFSDEQCPQVRFLYGTTFPHARRPSPSPIEAARETGFARGRPHSFRGNHFSSFLPVEISCPATPADRLAENHCTFFGGNHFPSFLPAETGATGSTDIGRTGDRRMFFEGTTFPHSVGFTDAPLAPDSFQQFFFSSSSLQRGSGIPAVPKTGASVLRLLPPTS